MPPVWSAIQESAPGPATYAQKLRVPVRRSTHAAAMAGWDDSGTVNSNDYFAFLNDYFDGNADFNSSGTTNSDDFFAFLTAYFNGCP